MIVTINERMKAIVLSAVCLLNVVYTGSGDDTYDFGDRSKWIDPSDMLNYDSSQRRMKKFAVCRSIYVSYARVLLLEFILGIEFRCIFW